MIKIARLNAICPYFSIFPLDFALKFLKHSSGKKNVFDPFCGRGTTNFAARMAGFTNYGIDDNKLAIAISKAKLVSPEKSKIFDLIEKILCSPDSMDLPEGEFFELCYHKNVLKDIVKFRSYFLNRCDSDEELALRALILGLMHGPLGKTQMNYLSNQMPRTFATKPDYSVRYWKSKGLIPPVVETSDLLLRRFDHVYGYIPEKVKGEIYKLNSFDEKDWELPEKIDLTITSPPYFGMATYLSDQWLRLWFLGDNPKVNYTTKSQLGSGTSDEFVMKLSKVWKKTAKVSNPKAKLIIRFGGIPSYNRRPPYEILKQSLETTEKWKIISKFNAGMPKSQRRQANQMMKNPGNYIEEFDLISELKD